MLIHNCTFRKFLTKLALIMNGKGLFKSNILWPVVDSCWSISFFVKYFAGQNLHCIAWTDVTCAFITAPFAKILWQNPHLIAWISAMCKMSFGSGISWSYTRHRQGFWPRIKCSQMKWPNFGSPSSDGLSKIGRHFSNKLV